MSKALTASTRTREQDRVRKSVFKSVWSQRMVSALLYTLLIGGSVMFMIPVYVMIVMSLKTAEEVARSSPWALPMAPTLENYVRLLTDPNLNFVRKFFNTMLLSVVPTIGVVLSSAMVAYPFARLKFHGRDRLFIILLSTMMLPGVVTMIPGYMLFAELRWIDTYWPFLIPPFLGGGAFFIFLVRQYMLGIPREMDEAAKIDGATNAVIFWRVLLPNCGPVLATVAVFTFIGAFRDFMGPLMIINTPEKQTMEVALRSLSTQYGTEFHLLMAGAMIVMTPIVVIFLLCQRYFVRGIALTGGK